jgi:hypothetical protein
MNQQLNGNMATPEMGLVLAESFRVADARLDKVEKSETAAPLLRFDAYCAWTRGFIVFGKTIAERMSQAATDSPIKLVPVKFREDVEAAMTNGLTFRRLLTTEGGYIGTGPYETEPGDVVAILLGYNVPILLRPAKSGLYTVIGEAYIHGIMYGEGLAELRKRDLVPEVFRLA